MSSHLLYYQEKVNREVIWTHEKVADKKETHMPSFFDLYSRYLVNISSTVGDLGSFTSCTKRNL